MKKTIVARLPIEDTSAPPIPLDKRLADLCDTQYIAGYRLRTMCEVDDELIVIFQLP